MYEASYLDHGGMGMGFSSGGSASGAGSRHQRDRHLQNIASFQACANDSLLHDLARSPSSSSSSGGTGSSTKKEEEDKPKCLQCFGVGLDKVRMINVGEQSEPVPVVLAFLAYLLRAPIPAEEGRPHLTDGLMFPHLFREEPEESLKEEAMYAIDEACSYDDKDGLNDMNIRLRDINCKLAFNRPLLASAIKIYLNRLPSKLLEKIDSRLLHLFFR